MPSALSEFRNEPTVDFKIPANAEAQRAAIEKVRGQLGLEYGLVIGGKRIETPQKIASHNPANLSEIIGTHQMAGPEHLGPAMEAAQRAYTTWSRVPATERADWLFRVAALLRKRKFEFNAWMMFEVGKNWAEAEADTCEAIDFCEMYARTMLDLAEAKTVVQLPGERDELRYIPLGVGAVLPPWNFPLAICCGMTVAAVVAGNTVILKPSSDSPTVAAKFYGVMEEAGLPAGVVNFCHGDGPTFGASLVTHPKMRFISFTGSRAVGLEISQKAAEQHPGQVWIKRTILEMGGKDAIVVADDADVDAAVAGVVAAAFGFSGQKCSACSRVIVDASVYHVFLKKLVPAVEAIQLGNPLEDPPMGPVINQKAVDKITHYIEIGKEEGRLLTGGKRVDRDGYFIEPTVIADVAPEARLAQEEVFGPVLAVIRAGGFDDALRIANGTEYGLTGAIYTQSEERIERAKQEFHVGNLYINRKCTGAIVGAHPFGGFNMSGTDSKAGGADYLYLLTQAKSIATKL